MNMINMKLREVRLGAIVTAAIVGFGLVASTGVIANGVVHSVHVGGPDICGFNPGCDKNFSLSALEFADGSVTGKLIDRWAGGGREGFHATIDCIYVDDYFGGKIAWVSGMVIEGMAGDQDLAGMPVWAAAVDWGKSNNDDADAITFSIIGDPTPCYEQPDPLGVPAGFLYRGQVKVK